jgi:hypothetical protein
MADHVLRMTTSAHDEPATTKLWLRSYEDPGFIYRDVSTRPPRDCTTEEIPVIDLTGMFGDIADRRKLSAEILHAAETSGFFYIKNHRVTESTIAHAHEEVKKFFYLPEDAKLGVKADPAVSFYGYQGPRTRRVDPGAAIGNTARDSHSTLLDNTGTLSDIGVHVTNTAQIGERASTSITNLGLTPCIRSVLMTFPRMSGSTFRRIATSGTMSACPTSRPNW